MFRNALIDIAFLLADGRSADRPVELEGAGSACRVA